MTKLPLLPVGIVCRNRPAYLSLCLRSLLASSCPEYVKYNAHVFDDASDDPDMQRLLTTEGEFRLRNPIRYWDPDCKRDTRRPLDVPHRWPDGEQLARHKGPIKKRLEDSKITLELTDKANELLANTGFDPVYGARPLKRTIQHLIQDPLAMKLLDGSIKEGDHVKVTTEDGKLVFK